MQAVGAARHWQVVVVAAGVRSRPTHKSDNDGARETFSSLRNLSNELRKMNKNSGVGRGLGVVRDAGSWGQRAISLSMLAKKRGSDESSYSSDGQTTLPSFCSASFS
jgi:hypothetical protein